MGKCNASIAVIESLKAEINHTKAEVFKLGCVASRRCEGIFQGGVCVGGDLGFSRVGAYSLVSALQQV